MCIYVYMLKETGIIRQFRQILTENASMVLNLDFQLDFICAQTNTLSISILNVNRIHSVDLVDIYI